MTLTPLRTKVVAEAKDDLAKDIFYSYLATRPIPLAAILAKKKVRTDCSGAAIGIYDQAGAPDPSGDNYNGAGNTDSLFAHCEHLTSYTNCLPADLIDVVRGDGTEHVYLVLERHANGDFLVFSNGGPGSAKSELLSGVKDYWYNLGYHFVGLRELAVAPEPPHWLVLNGVGVQLAKTDHPATWAHDHSHSFRKWNQVRFKQIHG